MTRHNSVAGAQVTAPSPLGSRPVRSCIQADNWLAAKLEPLGGSYNLALTASPPSGSSFAAGQLTAWIQDLTGLLPSGDGAVNCVPLTELCLVTVQWDDSHGLAGSGSQQVQITARL